MPFYLFTLQKPEIRADIDEASYDILLLLFGLQEKLTVTAFHLKSLMIIDFSGAVGV